MEPLPITVDPEILSGTPVFRGTRVPVETLVDERLPEIVTEATSASPGFKKRGSSARSHAHRTRVWGGLGDSVLARGGTHEAMTSSTSAEASASALE